MDVINLSLGSPYGDAYDTTAAAANNAAATGVIVHEWPGNRPRQLLHHRRLLDQQRRHQHGGRAETALPSSSNAQRGETQPAGDTVAGSPHHSPRHTDAGAVNRRCAARGVWDHIGGIQHGQRCTRPVRHINGHAPRCASTGAAAPVAPGLARQRTQGAGHEHQQPADRAQQRQRRRRLFTGRSARADRPGHSRAATAIACNGNQTGIVGCPSARRR